jgi:hypothetical protein
MARSFADAAFLHLLLALFPDDTRLRIADLGPQPSMHVVSMDEMSGQRVQQFLETMFLRKVCQGISIGSSILSTAFVGGCLRR